MAENELAQTEGEIDKLLRKVIDKAPDAEQAKSDITALGHAIIDQTGEDEIGDTMDRLLALDPVNGRERYDVLGAAWESVGREGDEHWT